jgi:hypothetical protein
LALLGNERLLLFNEVVYADALPGPMKTGLAHAVYQVDDVAIVLARFRANGVAPMWGPLDLTTPFWPKAGRILPLAFGLRFRDISASRISR